MPGAGPESAKVQNLLTGNRHSFYLTQAVEAERHLICGSPDHIERLRRNPGDLVIDPMAGMCGSLEACWSLGRRGTAVEISEQYCELAARRMEQELAQGRLFEAFALEAAE